MKIKIESFCPLVPQTLVERTWLLFGRRNGLWWMDENGVPTEGSQVVSAESLGVRYRHLRWLIRAQNRFLRRRRVMCMKTILLCLSSRLGQNTWVRIDNFLRRPRSCFLSKLGFDYLGPFVSPVFKFIGSGYRAPRCPTLTGPRAIGVTDRR